MTWHCPKYLSFSSSLASRVHARCITKFAYSLKKKKAFVGESFRNHFEYWEKFRYSGGAAGGNRWGSFSVEGRGVAWQVDEPVKSAFFSISITGRLELEVFSRKYRSDPDCGPLEP